MPAKTFTYKYKGKTIKCPSIANPTVGVLRKLRKIPESEQAFFICEGSLTLRPSTLLTRCLQKSL